MDNEHIVWIRYFSVSMHPWNVEFFTDLTASVGTYLNSDGNMEKRRKMDVAHVMIRTQSFENVNRVLKVSINKVVFKIRLSEIGVGLFNRVVVVRRRRLMPRHLTVSPWILRRSGMIISVSSEMTTMMVTRMVSSAMVLKEVGPVVMQ